METIIGIYKITNLINGKVYIGQSTNIYNRWKKHKRAGFNPQSKEYEYPLYRSMRKYGVNNFSFEILERCPVDELNDREKYYIEKHSSCDESCGYNQTEGGSCFFHGGKLTEDEILQIILRLKTTCDNTQKIGADFGVSYSTIRDINVGHVHRREGETYPIRPPLYHINNVENKCIYCGGPATTSNHTCFTCYHLKTRKVDRPDSLELAKLVKENGFEKTGREFGVSGNTVKKWCVAYGIPRHKNALVAWYDEQVSVDNENKVREEYQTNHEIKREIA